MLSDSELKTRFIAALEEVTPAAPWLSYAVKGSLAGVDSRRSTQRPRIRIGSRLAAVVALVALVAAVVAGLLLQHFPVPPPIPAAPHVPFGMQWREGGMIDRDVGWTLVSATYGDMSSDRVLRTTDGGHSWQLVTPTASAKVKAGSFIDGDHASVTVVGGSGETSQLYTFRTVDGGATWQVGNPTPPASIGFEISTSFLDPLNGWLLYTDRLKGGVLYRTTDGGMHWRLLANRPADDASFTDPPGAFCYTWCRVQFLSLTRGWIESLHPKANQSGLFVTGDGGVTWKPQPLPLELVKLNCACEQDLPQFADDAHGFTFRGASSVGQYSPRDPQDHLALFATDDGGASWSVRPLPGAGQMRIGFRDAQHGWVIAASASTLLEPFGRSDAPNLPLPLYVTSDGGRTWTPVPTTQPLQSSAGVLNDLYFVDAQTAFAWTFRFECVRTSDNPEACSDPGGPLDTGTLLRSDDGGRTWKAIWVTH